MMSSQHEGTQTSLQYSHSMPKKKPDSEIAASYKLKSSPPAIPTFSGTSAELVHTNVLQNEHSPRKYYLVHSEECLPPVISSSPFVPPAVIEHLMRNKKDRAIGVKFVREGGGPYRTGRKPPPPDEITNMEGALHTFVTPITLCLLHCDYSWGPGHGTRSFKVIGGKQQARRAIISASIQPDFENTEVMLEMCALRRDAIPGATLPAKFTIPDVEEKQDEDVRADYDAALKAHMIYHLTLNKTLPAQQSVQPIRPAAAIELIEKLITKSESATFQHTYVQLANGSIISLEILFNTAIHQFRNEFSALAALAPQCYVYTFDPASIFAAQLAGDATLLNRLYIAALQLLARENDSFTGMRVFAFNDYVDKEVVRLAETALEGHKDIKVVSKSELFNEGRKPGELGYQALPGTEAALLVLHNNSDAFGQNIETEGAAGSMDGALGAASSAAACLERRRADLVQWVM
jgi:hypothetical protein